MLTGEEIHDWKERWAPHLLEENVKKKAEVAAGNLAYEFDHDYMHDLLTLVKEFPAFFSPDFILGLSIKAEQIHDHEHNY